MVLTSSTIALDIGSRLPLGPVWGSLAGFIGIMVAVVFVIGAASRNLSIGAIGGYMMFSHLTLSVDDAFLNNIFLVSMVLIVIAFSFKLYRSEVSGT